MITTAQRFTLPKNENAIRCLIDFCFHAYADCDRLEIGDMVTAPTIDANMGFYRITYGAKMSNRIKDAHLIFEVHRNLRSYLIIPYVGPNRDPYEILRSDAPD